MKHAKKLLAILICLAMLPWTMFAAFADEGSQTEPEVLYSAVFDKSGDEADKLANWKTAAFSGDTSTYNADTGALQFTAVDNWSGLLGPNAGEIPSSKTYTLKAVYRHTVAPASNMEAFAIINGSNKETVSFRCTDDSTDALDKVYGAGVIKLPYWGDGTHVTEGVTATDAAIPADIAQAMKDLAWITFTLEVVDGTATKLTIGADGVNDAQEYIPATTQSFQQNLDASDFVLRFRKGTFELKEFTVTGIPYAAPAEGLPYTATFDNTPEADAAAANWTVVGNTVKNDESDFLSVGAKMKVAGDELALSGVALNSCKTFTFQTTFRYTAVADATGALCLSVGGDTKASIRYNGEKMDSFTAGTGVDLAALAANWKIGENGEPGAWHTLTLEVNEGVLSKLTVKVGDVTQEFTGTTATTVDGIKFMVYGVSVDIYDVRIMEGVGLDASTINTPAYPTSGTGGVEFPEYVKPEIEQPANAGEVLYSMTFDGSGDELIKAGEWTGAHTLLVQEGTGLLRVSKRGGWDKTTLAAGTIPTGTNTFTAQITLRHLSNCDAGGGVSLGFSDYELGWRVNNQAWGNLLEYTDGTVINGYFGTQWFGERIPGEIVNKWVAPEDVLAEFTGVPSTAGEWVTVTLEVENGVPSTVTVECGDQKVTFDYQGRNDVKDVDASNAWFYFSNVGVEIYDYRVVSGTRLNLVAPEAPDVDPNGSEESGGDNMGTTEDVGNDEGDETVDTTAPATEDTTEAVAEEEKKGCGSSVGSAFAVMFIVLSAGAILTVKRRKDF